ncbi:MAG: ABC transporter permease subunit [Planctomycetota bacterium]
MVSTLWIIAWNTFTEARRDKVLGILIIFTIILLLSSLALAELSIGSPLKIIRDISISAISLLCMLITIFLGTNMISKEIEKRTIYTILSKDCTRTAFLLGKFLGLITTYVICVLGMGILFTILYVLWGGTVGLDIPIIFMGIFFELLLLNAIAIFFALVLTSPIMAAIITFVFYVCGHASELMQPYVKETIHEGREFIQFMYKLIPNLRNFDYNQLFQAGLSSSEISKHIFWTSSYALVYTSIFLLASCLVFEKKNF